jgi:hypothetical protein
LQQQALQDLAASDSVRRSKLLRHLARHRPQVLLLQQRHLNIAKLQENTLSIVTAKLILLCRVAAVLLAASQRLGSAGGSRLRTGVVPSTASREAAYGVALTHEISVDNRPVTQQGNNAHCQCDDSTIYNLQQSLLCSVHALYSGRQQTSELQEK